VFPGGPVGATLPDHDFSLRITMVVLWVVEYALTSTARQR